MQLLDSGERTTAGLADLFRVGRSTVYRARDRQRSCITTRRPQLCHGTPRHSRR